MCCMQDKAQSVGMGATITLKLLKGYLREDVVRLTFVQQYKPCNASNTGLSSAEGVALCSKMDEKTRQCSHNSQLDNTLVKKQIVD